VRAWKGAETDPEKVFLYFREHADKFFTEDHVAAQIKVGRRRTRARSRGPQPARPIEHP